MKNELGIAVCCANCEHLFDCYVADLCEDSNYLRFSPSTEVLKQRVIELQKQIDKRKRTKKSYDSRIEHCPVCQTLCEIKNCYEDENIYRFEPLVSFTPTEIQFITNRLEETIEEWGVPETVFIAYKILRKLEKQQ